MTWLIGFKGPSGFSAKHTAEDVTEGVDGKGLTAIVTGFFLSISLSFCFLHFLEVLDRFSSRFHMGFLICPLEHSSRYKLSKS